MSSGTFSTISFELKSRSVNFVESWPIVEGKMPIRRFMLKTITFKWVQLVKAVKIYKREFLLVAS